jgi:hypothetical protein
MLISSRNQKPEIQETRNQKPETVAINGKPQVAPQANAENGLAMFWPRCST